MTKTIKCAYYFKVFSPFQKVKEQMDLKSTAKVRTFYIIEKIFRGKKKNFLLFSICKRKNEFL